MQNNSEANSQTDATQHDAADSSTNSSSEIPRRGFMTKFAAACIGALVGIVPFLAGLTFFLDPLIRRKQGLNDFIDLDVDPDSLNETPRLVTVYTDIEDAWNKFINQPIGTIWLRKIDGKIACLSSVCPHLGCSVDFRQSDGEYFCPCHTSAFELDGQKKNKIPPRGMDDLEVRVATDKKTGKKIVQVKYARFRSGPTTRIPV